MQCVRFRVNTHSIILVACVQCHCVGNVEDHVRRAKGLRCKKTLIFNTKYLAEANDKVVIALYITQSGES